MNRYSSISMIVTAVAAVLFFQACTSGRSVSDPAPVTQTAVCTAFSALPAHPSEIAFDSLDWKVPLGDAYRTEIAPSVVAYVASDSSLPLVNVEGYILGGSLDDPDGKDGLGAMTARLMRAGGTEKYPADTLDALIDLLAMRFSFSQAEPNMTFQAAWLSDYTDTAMDVMSQMLYHPAFEEGRIERERDIMIENIRHRFVNPGPTLVTAYRKHIYQGHGPARLTSSTSLRSITRDDLVNRHKTVIHGEPYKIIMSVSGKFDRDEMIERLKRIFAAPRSAAEFTRHEISIVPQTQALIVHRDINQAHVRMGLPLFKRPHPDYYAVSVLNYIMGGSGFTSRLGMRIRSDEGLTYSIHSSAESNYTYPGTLRIDFNTRTDMFPKAISIILEEIDKIIADGVTETELENAKTALIAELPSSFRSPEDIVSTYAWNEFFGRAPDHYAKYPDELRKLTREDLARVARKYIAPDKFTYTIVGDTTAINAASTAAAADGFFTLDSIKNIRVVTVDSLVNM